MSGDNPPSDNNRVYHANNHEKKCLSGWHKKVANFSVVTKRMFKIECNLHSEDNQSVQALASHEGGMSGSERGECP
ncbi:hypothetical protein OUZ56_024938 [Daphnia magna]|uniref:Uncharacterized protein n=1 Tax=Daphnia magna TaxID=35525 RepID=A0ABQ9ZIF6_9CRUS|nr:hypothetical protein OUZ56_024938 [Daphnia magna]